MSLDEQDGTMREEGGMESAALGLVTETGREIGAIASEGVPKREVPNKPVSSPMAEAIRSEVVRLCTEGDRQSGGVFNARVCSHIVRLVSAGREILLSEKISAMDARELLRRRLAKGRKPKIGMGAGLGIYSNTSASLGFGDSESDDVLLDEDEELLPLVGSGATENFGVQVTRQVVEAARAANNSPEKIVEAIAKARKLGMEDVAKKLEAKLSADVDSPQVDGPKALTAAPPTVGHGG